MGVTLYAFVYGHVPFHDENVVALYSKIRHQSVEFPAKPEVSDSLKELIRKMLVKDPSLRITLPNIKVIFCFLRETCEICSNRVYNYIFWYKVDPWVTKNGCYPLPSEEENCHLVEVTEEDVAQVITSIPKLDTLILIKHMLRKHSFQVSQNISQ